jgi:hypothetical protein
MGYLFGRYIHVLPHRKEIPDIQSRVANRILGAHRYALAAENAGFFPTGLNFFASNQENMLTAGLCAYAAAGTFGGFNRNDTQNDPFLSAFYEDS